ncbi:MAG: hypothetical protein NC205_06830 [Prevotella sp.]|nr:hypothetical protein [Alistipes senegalensis]MCM1358293.1 hypothetical protein [Prevotella sp.]MCM1474157.1 hypothetical protein [Muribaculaceae bacterium]
MDFKDIYEKYDKIKELKDYIDYENEISTNRKILNSCPFEEETAKNQIDKLINKYGKEINAVAILSGNGMHLTNNPPQKTPIQTWNELNYLNSLIPLFALERKAITNYLKQQIQGDNING